MFKSTTKKLLAMSLTCISIPCAAAQPSRPQHFPREQPVCTETCHSSRVSARHIENKGIGYKTGYTTVEGFFAAPTDLWPVMPFLDLRSHIFNDGHWAANAGLGVRSLLSDRIYGAYVYYDYRDTKHKNFNQVSFGVETLGTFWDLRMNGYVVVGDGKSRKYDTKFSQFKGQNIFLSQKFQYALSGGNAEAGFYPLKMRNVTLYTGFGPYYLKGPSGDALWGGQVRTKAMWKDYVGAEISYSYDHTFKNIVQGQVFLSCPLGPKAKTRGSKERSCIDNYLLCQRMIEPVAKSEIIPVSTKKIKKLAINPATGQPFTIVFVNNLSNSLGTYESPYSTLAIAQNASKPNDIIYVYPGDLTTRGLSNGITLQDGQQLLAATSNQTLRTTAGKITLPAQASGSNAPLLSNGAGAVVTLANNNVVSGFYIQNTAGPGILGSGINNATLTQNYIQGINTTNNGIELDNTTGTINAISNTIMYQNACVNINNSNPISNASYLFTNNIFHSEAGDYGINIAYTEGSSNYFLSSNNIFYASDSAAINITCSNTVANAPHIFNITNSNIGSYDDYGVQITLNNDSTAQLNITDSIFTTYYGVYTITNNQSQLNTNITNNTFNVYEYAFEPETHNTSLINATFTNNTIYCYEYGIYTDSVDSSTLAVNISNNNITSLYDYPIYSDVSGSATLTGTINNNSITALYDGFYAEIINSSTFALDFNNNVFNSAYYHIDFTIQDSATYSGNIIGNTFIGQDEDDTVDLNISTSANVSANISNNSFTGNYSGMDISNGGTGTTTVQILNNTVQNSSDTGIFLTNSGTNIGATISGNSFKGFKINAVNVANSGGDMCLNFNNNSSSPYPNAYVINETGGTLNLVTPTGNLGQLQTTGTTPVSSCP